MIPVFIVVMPSHVLLFRYSTGMSKVLEVKGKNGVVVGYGVRCPACDAEDQGHMHLFYKRTADGKGWTFDGNYESPTFSPSMLAQCHYGPEQKLHRCHSFVKNGSIQYLGDCTHSMKGQTVVLPDWE